MVSMGSHVVANSLCRRRTRSTMRETQVQSENSGLVRFVSNPNIQRDAVKRLVANFFVISAICLSLWATNAGEALAEGGGKTDPAVLKADQTLQSAVKKGDEKAVGALLDEQFTSTNEAGQTLGRAQFLRDSKTAVKNTDIEYTDVEAPDFGQLAVVRG